MNPRSGFVRDTGMLALGLGLAQLITLAVMPVWARQYDAAAFAALGLWMAVVAVVSTAVLLRYDTCIVIAADEPEARVVLRLCLRLALGVGAVLAAVAFLLPASWRDALGLAALGAWLPLAVLAGAGAAAMAALLAWCNRRRAYGLMSTSRIAQAGVAAAGGVALGASAVPAGLLWAQILGVGAGLLSLAGRRAASTSPSLDVTGGAGAPAPDLATVARQHSQAPRYLWPSALLDTVTQQLPMLLAVAWFSTAAAGAFSLTWRTVAVPVLMLAAAAGPVFYERFARAAAADRPAARRLLVRTWVGFALIGLLPTLALMAAGEVLFGAVFGPQWRDAGTLAAVLAPMLWLMLVSSPTSGALIVLGLQRWSPVFGLAMLVYRPGALWLGAQHDSLALGLALWGVCEVVAITLYNVLVWRALASPPAAVPPRPPD